jgi:hypothetical protein
VGWATVTASFTPNGSDVDYDVYGEIGVITMGDMIRKQLYIERRHEDLLKRRSAELGVTEAEIVREALDSFMAYSGTSSRDSGAWKEEKAFIEELISTGKAPGGRAWDRDDLHER